MTRKQEAEYLATILDRSAKKAFGRWYVGSKLWVELDPRANKYRITYVDGQKTSWLIPGSIIKILASESRTIAKVLADPSIAEACCGS